MKLWVLRPIGFDGDVGAVSEAWDPWYDKAFGFVVCAETEELARKIAGDNAGDEKRGENFEISNPWLDKTRSSCVELKPENEGLIMRDFAAA